jgi:hypothetical protein
MNLDEILNYTLLTVVFLAILIPMVSLLRSVNRQIKDIDAENSDKSRKSHFPEGETLIHH